MKHRVRPGDDVSTSGAARWGKSLDLVSSPIFKTNFAKLGPMMSRDRGRVSVLLNRDYLSTSSRRRPGPIRRGLAFLAVWQMPSIPINARGYGTRRGGRDDVVLWRKRCAHHRHCERSEAIQSHKGKLDCFVASAPRNDELGYPATRPSRISRTHRRSPGASARAGGGFRRCRRPPTGCGVRRGFAAHHCRDTKCKNLRRRSVRS